ncbi:Cysteine desulfurase [Alloactinosynnema sp. L-07]|uniref:cysteine desulfurase family protein n=1 Tax=Alloactinosynnema sp. L-07 TaxID=1653480 RepID=UPI00065EFB03|nr:cysteine desulfurase family protein [Alloactinosynnema sp. L-07]CRK57743.1 Cysteine desulfurase [Alloactinosynnema sp. L-07]
MTVPTGPPVYLDHNATTPVDPRVTAACLPYLTEHFGNPSSGHTYGHRARRAVDTARASVAEFLGCAPGEVVFSGSGSESDTLAIRGAALAARERGDHVITQLTEHPAVIAACDALRRLHGFRVTELPVNGHGLVDPAALAAALTDRTVLVSIMHANNETGTVQPIRELAALTHTRGALFHTDAAQSAAKLDLSVRDLGVDLLTIAGHKMYAPKGVGALYVRQGLDLEPTIYGGGQESGRRGGTENVALIVALGAAARLAMDDHSAPQRLQHLRDLLHTLLDENLPGRVHLNGHPTHRLPNTLNLSIDGTLGAALLAAVPGIAASTGSACHEGETRPSAVLTAMGHPPGRALAALRLTLGRSTTAEDIQHAATQLTAAAS